MGEWKTKSVRDVEGEGKESVRRGEENCRYGEEKKAVKDEKGIS